MKKEDLDYLISEAKISPLDENFPLKKKQNIKCLLCNKIYFGSPFNKRMNYKIYGATGCPACAFNAVNIRNRNKNIEKIKEDFIILTSDPLSLKKLDKILVQNKNCNHVFESVLSYLTNDNVKCPICWKENNKNARFVYKNGDTIKKETWTVEKFLSRLEETNLKRNNKIKCLNPKEYTGINVKLCFICDAGHEFKTKAAYLAKTTKIHGCPDCAAEEIRFNTKYSKKAIEWLEYISKKENIEIQHALNGSEFTVRCNDGKYYYADGYCRETNTVYEFHGSVFHGDPFLFKPEEKCHPYKDISAKELYEATMLKEHEIQKAGYNLISIWEREWDEILKKLS